MKTLIKKTISILITFAFLLNVVLPLREVSAMTGPWWSGSQANDTTSIPPAPPSEGSQNDNRQYQKQRGDPIFVHNGDFVYENQDILIVSRGINTEITRTYKSQSRYNNRFGFGWDIFYNKKIIPLCNGDLFYLNGKLNRFKFSYIDGTNYISPAGIYDKIVQNVDGTYTLTENHGTVYTFDQNGALTEIRDRNANALHFTYDAEGKLPIIGISPYSNDPSPKIIAYDYKLIRITDTVERQINFTYNDDGKLTSITDFAGRTYSYNYDPSGNGDLISFTTPATAEFPTGNTTTYAYLDHNLTTITDAKSQTYLTNHYDSNDRVDVQNYGTGTFSFSYDETNRKTTVTNPKGYATEYGYDQNGSVLSKKEFTTGLRPTDPASYITNYTYNSALERTQVTNPKANGIKYVFDEGNPDFVKRGNLLEIRKKTDMAQPDNDTNDIVTRFTYEPNFNFIQTLTDPKGKITTFNYDANGNLVAIVYPQAGGQIPQTTITYNTFGQIETVTDPNNNLTRYEYFTETGYLKKIIQDPNGINAITQFAYDSVGNVTSVINANGLTTNFTYNALNQLISQKIGGSFNYLTKYYYDANGNLTKIENRGNAPSNQWQITEYSYTALDQLETIKQYLNPTTYLQTSLTYDLNGNRTSITDAENNVTTFQYDERDLIWKTIDANTPAGITEYFYDLNGNLEKIKDAKSQETAYSYDNFDRLQTTTYADTSYKQFTYDKNSNLVGLQSPNSNLISYTYDSLNRLDLKTYPNATTVDYVYDVGSRLTSVENPVSSIGYQYDNLNRITSNTNTLNSTPYTLTYEYDKLGNRTRVTYPSGKDIRYTYDLLSQLTKITPDNNILATFAYDFLGRRYQKDLANSIDKRTTYKYDLANRLTQLKNTTVPGQPPGGIKYPVESGALENNEEFESHVVLSVRRLCDSLDVNRIRNPKTTDDTSSVTLGRTTKDGYADFSFLNPFSTQDAFAQGPTLNTQYTYSYDNAGNRLSRQIQSTSVGNSLENYVYDDIYQLTDVTGDQTHNYQYDSVGNRSNVDGTAYVPNNLNQYTQVGAANYVNDANGNLTNDGVYTYGYDYEDRLTSAVGNGHNATYTYDPFGRRISKTVDGVTTYFVYDTDQVIEERDASGNLSASYVYGTGIDEILTMQQGASTYYYFYDGLGSVTEITNSTGELEESYNYDVYGQPSQVSTIGNRFMFTGREYDDESGLYHYRARTYSPIIGRFLQRDPVTWSPDDRRILNKSTNLSEVIFSILGIHSTSNLEKKRIEQELLLSHQFRLSPQYFAVSATRLSLNADILKAIISGIGQLDPRVFNLYPHTHNNPVNYIDPDGQIVLAAAIVASVLIIAILAHQMAYYLGKFEKPKPEEPGPPLQPYSPMNPMQERPTGRLPCGR